MMEQFFRVYRWMGKELPFSGCELDVFALLYGFTENCGQYDGSLQYIADYVCKSKQAVFEALKKLCEKGLIAKTERQEGALKYCVYRTMYRHEPTAEDASTPQESAAEPYKKPEPSVQETVTEPYKKLDVPVQETVTAPYKKLDLPVQETVTNNKGDMKHHNKVDKISSAPAKNRYGEYHNVLLTQEELEKLRAEFPEDWQRRIERLSAYMASTGKGYKNHLATIRNWAMRDEKEKPKQEESPFAFLKGGLSL